MLFIEIGCESAFARRQELRAIFPFAILQDRIGGVHQIPLISQFIGIGIEQDNMRVAFLQGIHERGVGIGDDRNNGIAGSFGKLGGDHFRGIDLFLRIGRRGQSEDQRIFSETKFRGGESWRGCICWCDIHGDAPV